jgi:plastocyanin
MRHSPERSAVRLLPLCMLLACESEPTTPSSLRGVSAPVAAVTDNRLATFAVSPDSQMVFVGDTFRIRALPRNRAGELLERSITWTIGNTNIIRKLGTTQADMSFRALKAGKTNAKATTEGKTRVSIAVVRGVSGAKVVVTPAEVTIEGGATVRFTAQGLTAQSETAGVNVTWTTNGGAISADGVLSGGAAPGTYRVIATSRFGAADTAAVTIAAGEPPADLILVPESVTLPPGGTARFEAYGLTEAGDSVGVTAAFSASGGSIGAGGVYTAGDVPGTFSVVASASGLADTSEVVVEAPGIDRVSLVPGVAASRPGEVTRFQTAVWNTIGAQVSEPVTWAASCGSVTAAGAYTAPLSDAGPCLLMAAAGDKADTTEVVMLRNTTEQGIPFGSYNMWPTATRTQSSGVAVFTGSHDYITPGEMVVHLDAARTRGMSIVLAMTGGSHDRYKTNGVFDQAKWEAAMDAYDTPAIRDAIAAAVADGTVIGNSVMDEPQQSGTDIKDWGPAGTMTKARVDELCGYVKGIFPTLPVGVGHDHNAFQPGSSYAVCQFFMPQYAARKGSVTAWRDAALAMAQRDGLAVVFSMNLLNGGVQDKTGAWDCPGTGGLGDRAPNCRMTPAQVRAFGLTLGPAGCAMLNWKYDSNFAAKPENQEAFSTIAVALAALPRPRCSAR